VKAVLLIGRDAPALKAAIEPSGVPCFDMADLPQAVRRAAGLARSGAGGGDVVLLSPACASLDMFTNYAHRAQVFVEAVRELALEKGQEI
jgi:UDP-N-acetylmuramoylalanine--D-glutamate ligase